jgi:Cd2+/Zn2+-exporting ATPase
MESTKCHVVPLTKAVTPAEKKNLAVAGLTVWGMGCKNCAARVRNSLIALEGVVEADVDHTTGFAFVEYNPDLVGTTALLEAVAKAGDNHHKYIALMISEEASA